MIILYYKSNFIIGSLVKDYHLLLYYKLLWLHTNLIPYNMAHFSKTVSVQEIYKNQRPGSAGGFALGTEFILCTCGFDWYQIWLGYRHRWGNTAVVA